jgi:transcriptional regulator with XRE-family HTH domain
MPALTQFDVDAGRRLRRIRRGKEMQITALARSTGFDRSAIHYLENGTLALRPVVAALLLKGIGEQPSPTEWPSLVCKLVEHLTLEELRALRSTRPHDARGIA